MPRNMPWSPYSGVVNTCKLYYPSSNTFSKNVYDVYYINLNPVNNFGTHQVKTKPNSKYSKIAPESIYGPSRMYNR